MEKRPPTEQARKLICDQATCTSQWPTTFYVHLDSGEIDTVPDVRNLEVTDTEIIFRRGRKKAARYPRSEVYYACCEKDDEPPSLF